MNAKKVCRRSFLTMIAAVFITAGFPVPNLTAFAAEKNEVTINATVKNAATLSPKTEYNTVSITDIYDVEILINGERDTDSAFYVLTKEAFDSLSDKSEEIVRNQSGFTTKDLTGPSSVEDVVFVTYHTFKNEVPVKAKPEAPAREEDKVKETEIVEETVMATCSLPVLITRSANDIAEYFKSDTWYESHENGVTWRYTLSEAGLVNRLYTESTDLSEYICDGTFFIPETIEGIPVTGIGSGMDITFIPKEVSFSELVFPKTLQFIGRRAFYGNKNTFKADIPFSVVNIGEKAFFSSGVTSLHADSPFINVEQMAFANCRALEDVTFGGRSCIGKRAFDGGMQGGVLKEVVFFGEAYADSLSFCNNKSLAGVSAAESLNLQPDSFKGCTELKQIISCGNVEIPEGMEENIKIVRAKTGDIDSSL